MSLIVEKIQSPQWTPIYSQSVFLIRDMLETHIFAPGKMTLKQQRIARAGKTNTGDFNPFNPNQKVLEPLKQRFPYLY